MSTARNVNGVETETEGELQSPAHSLARGIPFRDALWQIKTAVILGLGSSP